MTTLGELVSSISTSLHSFTGVQERVTWLTSAIAADDTTVAVASSETGHRGIAEIEDELIYVDSIDTTGLVLPPFGRGYRGSTAATHAINTEVVFDPHFPKAEIKKAINSCVQGLYPRLYQIKSTDIDYTPVPVGFDLPADCEEVLEVKANVFPDSYNYWQPLEHWSFDSQSPEANGKALNIMQFVQPGSTIRVVYVANFGELDLAADTLADAGIPESYADLILYCVSARMIRFLDPARLQVGAVENLSRSAVVASGDAGKVANQLYAMYQQRVAEERDKLLEQTPFRPNFTR